MTYDYRIIDGHLLARMEVDDGGWRGNGALFSDGQWKPYFTLDVIYEGRPLTASERAVYRNAIDDNPVKQ